MPFRMNISRCTSKFLSWWRRKIKKNHHREGFRQPWHSVPGDGGSGSPGLRAPARPTSPPRCGHRTGRRLNSRSPRSPAAGDRLRNLVRPQMTLKICTNSNGFIIARFGYSPGVTFRHLCYLLKVKEVWIYPYYPHFFRGEKISEISGKILEKTA